MAKHVLTLRLFIKNLIFPLSLLIILKEIASEATLNYLFHKSEDAIQPFQEDLVKSLRTG